MISSNVFQSHLLINRSLGSPLFTVESYNPLRLLKCSREYVSLLFTTHLALSLFLSHRE